jgi:hypothetical protein
LSHIPKFKILGYDSWNCRGLGQLVIVHELIALVRAKSLSMVFLMETQRSASRAMNLKWRLGLKNSVGVDSLGQGGGLVLFGMRV